MKKAFYPVLVFMGILWPSVHVFFTAYSGVSPWRLGGWGMYATPMPNEYRKIVIEEIATGSESREKERTAFPQCPNLVFNLGKESAARVRLMFESSAKRDQLYILALKKEVNEFLSFPVESKREQIEQLSKKIFELESPAVVLIESKFSEQEGRIVERQWNREWGGLCGFMPF